MTLFYTVFRMDSEEDCKKAIETLTGTVLPGMCS